MIANREFQTFKFCLYIYLLFFTLIHYGQVDNSLIQQSLIPEDIRVNSLSLLKHHSQEIAIQNFHFKKIGIVPLLEEGTIEIKQLKFNGRDTTKVEIKYVEPDTKGVSENIVKGQKFRSGTLFVIPANTEVVLRTSNNNLQTLRPGSKHMVSVTSNKEEHRTFWGKVVHFKNKVSNKISNLFSYRTSGGNKRWQAAAKGTEFSVEVDSNDVIFERFSGKVEINRQYKVELEEDPAIDSGRNRELFETQTSFLSPKHPKVSYNSDSLKVTSLDTQDEIDEFFLKQLQIEKRKLTNGGPLSRSAFKLLSEGQDSLGIAKYEEAMEMAEIEREIFIQAALIMTEGLFRKNKLKNNEVWLDAALYFTEQEHAFNLDQYYRFKEIGENEPAKGFGENLMTSKKYYAWAYTVKLKLTGCLETATHNPTKYLNEVEDLEEELEQF